MTALRLLTLFLVFSAGIGRTGTFIVIDILMHVLKEQGNDKQTNKQLILATLSLSPTDQPILKLRF